MKTRGKSRGDELHVERVVVVGREGCGRLAKRNVVVGRGGVGGSQTRGLDEKY